MAGKPAASAYSAEELELLTEEELEGLNDPDLVDDPEEDDKVDDSAAATIEAQRIAEQEAAAAAEAAAKAKKEADTAGAEAAAAAAKKAADEEAAKAAAAGDGVKAGETGAGADAGNEPPKPAAATPYPNWQAPENAQARLDDIEKQKDELAAKFDDGEMTAAEYREKLKPLDKAERDLRDDVFKANISQTANRDIYFNTTVPKFMSAHPEYAPGKPLYNALDIAVKELQAKADNPFDPQILEEAHKIVHDETLRALGIDPATVKKGDTTTATEKRPAPPPTLANVPAADLNPAADISKFAHLDKLSGEAYEDPIAKLSDADRDLHLQGA